MTEGQEAPRHCNWVYTSSLQLAAVPSAVSCSRMLVRLTLTRWKLADYVETAELVMSELVTNAVRATGLLDPEPQTWKIKEEHVIGVQLRAIGTSLVLDVWDRSSDQPVARSSDDDAEGGRGLLLVGATCKQWDFFRPHAGGKIVWAELELDRTAKPPPLSTMPVRIPGATKPPRGPVHTMAEEALLQRFLDALYQWDEPRAV
ncbi:ATP-binding protein [Streptomyces griseorubiginosus]|uniref:ATP-binding protein n=1 Tax=Streptomyces griseorubiginosus TaxID=67304 RepID=UPI002E81C0FD|nr:ATP-binding protein [Streptomyces griseorubiginosus]WUB46361.1 ATP-binding protein [Streptomyces griseorubiginosus]WUB54882.1 ATP-binding protein [Streptomyces griseorubiginosus]